jgi:DNA-binding transcriptional LysR family regulator
MHIDFRYVRYADAAEHCGSFAKTAHLLALKQSNRSRRIRHLEEQLGVALFERRMLRLIDMSISVRKLAEVFQKQTSD